MSVVVVVVAGRRGGERKRREEQVRRRELGGQGAGGVEEWAAEFVGRFGIGRERSSAALSGLASYLNTSRSEAVAQSF